MPVGALAGPGLAEELNRFEHQYQLTADQLPGQGSLVFEHIDEFLGFHDVKVYQGVKGDPTPEYFAFRISDEFNAREITVREFVYGTHRKVAVARHVVLEEDGLVRTFVLKKDGSGFEPRGGLHRLIRPFERRIADGAYDRFVQSLSAAARQERARKSGIRPSRTTHSTSLNFN